MGVREGTAASAVPWGRDTRRRSRAERTRRAINIFVNPTFFLSPSLYQVLTDSKTPHPAVQAVLPPPVYALYAGSDKPRQIALSQMTRLMERFVEKRKELCVPAYNLLDRGAAAAGVLTSIKFQALPIAITYTCTGFLELFLFTYPLTGLAKGAPPTTPAAAAHAHDTEILSVAWTLGVQAVLFFVINILFLGADEVREERKKKGGGKGREVTGPFPADSTHHQPPPTPHNTRSPPCWRTPTVRSRWKPW